MRACCSLNELLEAHGGGYRVTATLHSAPPEDLAAPVFGDGRAEWPLATAAAAAELAGRIGPYVSQLAIAPPSLERVFFNLTGHYLRDE